MTHCLRHRVIVVVTSSATSNHVSQDHTLVNGSLGRCVLLAATTASCDVTTITWHAVVRALASSHLILYIARETSFHLRKDALSLLSTLVRKFTRFIPATVRWRSFCAPAPCRLSCVSVAWHGNLTRIPWMGCEAQLAWKCLCFQCRGSHLSTAGPRRVTVWLITVLTSVCVHNVLIILMNLQRWTKRPSAKRLPPPRPTGTYNLLSFIVLDIAIQGACPTAQRGPLPLVVRGTLGQKNWPLWHCRYNDISLFHYCI